MLRNVKYSDSGSGSDSGSCGSGSSSNNDIDLSPPDQLTKIDIQNDYIYHHINNGVYRAGFATSQSAYETAVNDVFTGLSKIENILENNVYINGNNVTESDIFLLPTIVRFDAIYHSHFKCGYTTIQQSYPNISKWAKRMYKLSGSVSSCYDMIDAKRSYYKLLFPLNPSGIVPSTSTGWYDNLLLTTQDQ